MRSWISHHRLLVFLILVSGILVGLLTFWSPGLVVMLMVIIGVRKLVRQWTTPEDRRFLTRLYGLAILARLVLGAVLHLWAMYDGKGSLMYGQESFDLVSGDSAYLSLRGWIMAQTWLGRFDRAALYQGLFKDQGTALVYLYAWFHTLFGFSQFAVKLVNSLFGVLTALVSYQIVKTLCGRRTASLVAVLVAFFPSLFLWSMTNLKETPSALGLMWTCWALIRLIRQGPRLSTLGQLAGGLWLVWCARPILLFPVGLCVLLSVWYRLLTWPGRIVVRIGAAGMLMALLWGAPMEARIDPGSFWTSKLSTVMSRLLSIQQSHLLSPGSGYRIYDDAVYQSGAQASPQFTPGRIARAWVRGVEYFLLQPVPWKPSTSLQVLSIPEMVVWYPLLGLALWGALVLWRTAGAETMVLLVPLLVLTSLMALSTGNVGIAFRHRAIVLPLYLIFSAVGIGHRLGWLRRRGGASVPLTGRPIHSCILKALRISRHFHAEGYACIC